MGSKDYSLSEIDIIDSIAFDSNTKTELILGHNSLTSKSYFYLIEENKEPNIIENTLFVSNIESPLMKYNSIFYFCSPSYNKVLYITDNNILGEVYNNKIDKEDLQKTPGLKCFGMVNYMVVMYYNTESLYSLNPYRDNYGQFEKTYTQKEGNFKYKAFNILKGKSESFILLRVGEKNTNVTKIYFTNNEFMTENNGIFPKSLTFYSKNEIMATGQEAIVLTYEPNTIGKCNLYILDFGDPVKYYINLFSPFVKVLNESMINVAGFIEDTELLYYSIKKNNKEYFGVIDAYNLLEIYNIEKKGGGTIFTDYGYLSKNLLYLNYFDGKNKKIYCPFISKENSCKYYIDNGFFSINKINFSLYSNSFSGSCVGKKVKNYCLDNCPFGYNKEGNDRCYLCIKGDQSNKKYYSLKRMDCDALDMIRDHCPYYTDNICLDCTYNIYDYECIESCDQIFGEERINKTCTVCKDDDTYYYKTKGDDKGRCIKECPGKINYENNNCTKCKDLNEDSIYFRPINDCILKCPKYYIKNEDECKLCQNINKLKSYYENIDGISDIRCVEECLNETHAKIIENKTLEEFNLTEEIEVFLCNECPLKQYKQNDICVASCGDRYMELSTPYFHCQYCNESNLFFRGETLCYKDDKCPDYIKKVDNYCEYCGENKYFIDNNCVEKCSEHELGEDIGLVKINNEIKEIKICRKCEKNETLIDGKCSDKCFNNSYINKNQICKKCLCINENNDNIENNICDKLGTEYYKCNCLDNYSYGYNCEFLSKVDINEHNMMIISLENKYGLYRLIQSKKNYFTYKIKESTIDEKKYIFNWKLYLEKEEITNNKTYEKYFATNTNESIFGINKELFDFAIKNNKNISLSLSINKKDLNKNDENEDSYYHEIKIRLVNYESINKNLFKLVHPGDQINYEMNTIYSLNNQSNFRINEMQYYFQYELLDYYNERIPITPYLELENINFYSPYLKGFYINVKNDRDIITSTLISLNEETLLLNSSIKEINNNYSPIEKIFALNSNLRGNTNNIIKSKEDLDIINDIITKNIILSINENGYYYAENNFFNNEDDEEGKNNRYIITYSEPKLIFSLINNFLISQKDNLINSNDYEIFFKYFNKIFGEVLIENKLSNNTLS